jgi:hypothetical protein
MVATRFGKMWKSTQQAARKNVVIGSTLKLLLAKIILVYDSMLKGPCFFLTNMRVTPIS